MVSGLVKVCGEWQHGWDQKSPVRPYTRLWGLSRHPLSISLHTATLLVSLHCMWVLEMTEGWSEWKRTCWASRGRAQGDSGFREASGNRGYLGKVRAGNVYKDFAQEAPTEHPRRSQAQCCRRRGEALQYLRSRMPAVAPR